MSDKYLITRLVMGMPQTVQLGRPVGQRLSESSGTGLRWKDGKWVAARSTRLSWFRALFARPTSAIELRPRRAGALPDLWSSRQDHSVAATPVATHGGTRWGFGMALLITSGAFAAVALTGAAMIPLWKQRDVALEGLPIVHSAGAQQVRVVGDAYVPAQLAHPPNTIETPAELASAMIAEPVAEPPGSEHSGGDQSEAELPIAAPAEQGPLPVAAIVKPAQQQANPPRVSAPHAAPPVKLPQQAAAIKPSLQTAPVAAQVAPKKAPAASAKHVPAVVFDEATPARPALATPKNANPPASDEATPPVRVARHPPPLAAGSRFAQPVKDVSARRGGAAASPQPTVGLIAITPDGKTAVFTNPTTKLPQPFKIGEQLPSGETIRSIDTKAGKVATSAKEYSLD